MPLPDAAKPVLLVMILAWPVAGGLGLWLAHAVHQAWPAGALPAGWLAILLCTLRHASRHRPRDR